MNNRYVAVRYLGFKWVKKGLIPRVRGTNRNNKKKQLVSRSKHKKRALTMKNYFDQAEKKGVKGFWQRLQVAEKDPAGKVWRDDDFRLR